ncbi:MAG TPA: hypothetical protein VGG97_16940 [Bryobacteraceae bacterium]|jgi:hypothetical protein
MRHSLISLVMGSLFLTLCLVNAQNVHLQNLEDVARSATVMLDGDICLRIETARSTKFLVQTDPRDPWRAGDNYDVNAGAFIQTKKSLMRLARLCPEPCDVNLWMPVHQRPNRIQIVIRNVHELSQFWKWGDLDQDLPPEMKRVLDTAARETVRRTPGMTSVLAPVYDSMGDVVGVAEVVTEKHLDPRENVK